MLQGYWIPAFIRAAHSLEILGDQFVYAGALVALLAKISEPMGRQQAVVRQNAMN
jgi:hypothetical protein